MSMNLSFDKESENIETLKRTIECYSEDFISFRHKVFRLLINLNPNKEFKQIIADDLKHNRFSIKQEIDYLFEKINEVREVGQDAYEEHGQNRV